MSRRNDAIVVRANPKLADLIPGFLQNRRQDVIAMLEALDRGDFAIVESLGHGMKGAGGSWGFQAITDIGAALEQAAKSADNDASRKRVGELSQLPGSCRGRLRLVGLAPLTGAGIGRGRRERVR